MLNIQRHFALGALAAILAVMSPGLTPRASAQDAKPPITLDQRVSILEAAHTNADPSAALKTGKNEKGDPDFPAGFDAAKDAPTSVNSGPGHNAWMMASTALVLFMTLPGLALFYGGLVRKKNVLSVCAQCLACSGLVTILWWAVGYSLVFGKSYGTAFPFGGNEFFFLKDVGAAPNTDYCFWVSHSVFSMYQLMFAIITPALIIGAIAERMKFSAIMTFIGLWMFVVYFPMAHMVWGVTGLMNGVWNGDAKIPAIDFAGGTVVHMTSGWSALILCIILGKRKGFGKEKMSPAQHGPLYGRHRHALGRLVRLQRRLRSGRRWRRASNAFMTTTLAAATAGFVWAMIELIHKGHAVDPGLLLGHRRRPRCHHAGVRLRQRDRAR